MINFEINKELDYKVYLDFKNFSAGGVDFGEVIKHDYPSINFENYIEYIDKFYAENWNEIRNSAEESNSILKDKQEAFFSALDEFFGENYINEKFTGFIQIFNCNQRFIDDKSFQVFYKKSSLEKLSVSLHEITHFVFFDYVDANFPEMKQMSKDSGILWELSEIFNAILLNELKFKEISGKKEKLFYPALEIKLSLVKTLWEASEKHLSRDFLQKSLDLMR